MIEQTIDQRSDAWFQQRLGKVTASRVADVVAKTKTGISASRLNYLAQLVAERMTGRSQESYSSSAMQWGIETEPLARAAYDLATETFVIETGFHAHPEILMTGASPDGLVGNEGLLEIKCPHTATHIEYLLRREVPQKYFLQMQWQMACTERCWCDFVSFDPRMPETHQLLVMRVERDDHTISQLRLEIVGFLEEVEEVVRRLAALAT